VAIGLSISKGRRAMSYIDTDHKYGEAALKAREHFASKVTKQLNKNVTDYGLRFIKLIGLIPNWETYLTPKQREAAQRYIKCMNAYDVDYHLKLSSGTTHQRLFGSKTSKGALGRLEEVYRMLENNGYYEEQKKKQEVQTQTKKKRKMSKKSLMAYKELIKLIVEMPDYEKFLTKIQAERVFHFLRLRNVSGVARECKVTRETIQKSLIGEGGALEKLKEASKSRTVDTWEEI
jgi:DNA-binding phage protein